MGIHSRATLKMNSCLGIFLYSRFGELFMFCLDVGLFIFFCYLLCNCACCKLSVCMSKLATTIKKSVAKHSYTRHIVIYVRFGWHLSIYIFPSNMKLNLWWRCAMRCGRLTWPARRSNNKIENCQTRSKTGNSHFWIAFFFFALLSSWLVHLTLLCA